MSLGFDLLGTDGLARRGRITTAHGTVETPAFMPVGTAGTVKAMLPQSVAETEIFIHPGKPVRAVDLLLTNFHLPKSTLFMLVCAFAGTERMRAAYSHAIDTGYRFFSYGDAMFIA